MRLFAILLALLLIPMATGYVIVDEGQGSFGGTSTLVVVREGPNEVATHVDLDVQVMQQDRIWFQTQTMHEHDGIATFSTGIPNAHDITIGSGGDTVLFKASSMEADTTSRTWQPYVEGDPRVLNILGEGWVEAVAYGADGVWVRSWHRASVPATSWLNELNVDEDVEINYRALGQNVAASYASPAPEAGQKSVTAEELPACSTNLVRLDPLEIHVGNQVRVTTGSLEYPAGQVTYSLWRDVPVAESGVPQEASDAADTPVQEEIIMEWMSQAPSAESAFRVPTADVYRLRVDGQGLDCELLIDATADAGRVLETAALSDQFLGVEGTNLTFRLDVEGNGHYEHPTSVSYENNGTSFLIWSGKLHSHGTPVEFQIPDPLPGTYTVHWDTSAQGPDAIVPAPGSLSYTVVEAEPVVESAAPLGVLAVIGLAFLARRR